MLPESAVQIVGKEEVVKPKDFADVIRDKQSMERFVDIWGPRAQSYITSVILLYRSKEELQACTTNSIIGSALRSAACSLQVEPTYRQAYIIPRPRKIKTRKDPVTELVIPEHYITEANFQPHYHGLEVLAHRTNIYRVINVSPIYKGQRVLEDIHTGLHYFTVVSNDGSEIVKRDGEPYLFENPRISQLRDATMGKGRIEDVIGYLGYFETFKGQKKTEWMTIEEIEAHAKKYSDAYTSKYSLWAKDNPHRPVMQMKTCFIKLTKSMDLSGSEHEYLAKAANAGDEAQQAFEDEINNDDSNLDTEPRYQTDEFSQGAPTSTPPIIINTPPMTTGGQMQGDVVTVQPDVKPLPVVTPIGTVTLTYESAKGYYLGSKILEKTETFEMEKALDKTNVPSSTKTAIRVVLDWRKVNQ